MTFIKRFEQATIPSTKLYCKKCGSRLIKHPIRRTFLCVVDGHEEEITTTMINSFNFTQLNMNAIRMARDITSFALQDYDHDKSDVADGALDLQVAENEHCEKCGKKGLEYFTKQMRSANDGETMFLKCGKCKYIRVVAT
eukprot:TRINITY_DN76218_c0_g1_i1.p3 TRINITY_DN76218_c0_g1~~TRINITY_DN76218_c0_g1_i1.p3  ORF type:complete len:149 (-),score=15.20 TRINITY_DN76218_c0_g1_i1:179-598(-)